VVYQVVNLRQLDKLAGTEVSPESLNASGLIAEPDRPIKLLGSGDATRAYAVRGLAVSASARAKIEAAGGAVEG
jgi:large subunit ribosomal protein L15